MSIPRSDQHKLKPDKSFDGGDLDCGNGLLLLIRKHLDALDPGQLLEIKSSEVSVEEDLPAWCRLTKNELVSWTKDGKQRSYLVSKKPLDVVQALAPLNVVQALAPGPYEPPAIAAFFVTGIGSWPRPRWMLRAVHEYVEGKISPAHFNETADDAVRLAVEQQLKAGADIVTDGEQRRDNYSSFVGMHLENVQLIPLVDLLPLVDHPEQFEQQLSALDIPAELVRHPAVFGKLRRKDSIAAHECRFVRTITDKPVKVSLPGPYLLTRTMFLDCFKEKAYTSRDELARDIVAILREEIADLLAEGAALIQLDEPILTEVILGKAKGQRTFMCGALSERGDTNEELDFAVALLNEVLKDFPRERMAMHVCRGNWSPDESVALAGGYEGLLPVFKRVSVGTLFLEFCTARAGDLSILRELPADVRVGLGVVNPKTPAVEAVDDIVARARQAIEMVGAGGLLLNPDCGFATFADNPVADAQTASAKLAAMAAAAQRLKHE